MTTTSVPTKRNSKQTASSHASATNPNETPITEEELKKKETPITVSDVLRLNKSTNGI